VSENLIAFSVLPAAAFKFIKPSYVKRNLESLPEWFAGEV